MVTTSPPPISSPPPPDGSSGGSPPAIPVVPPAESTAPPTFPPPPRPPPPPLEDHSPPPSVKTPPPPSASPPPPPLSSDSLPPPPPPPPPQPPHGSSASSPPPQSSLSPPSLSPLPRNVTTPPPQSNPPENSSPSPSPPSILPPENSPPPPPPLPPPASDPPENSPPLPSTSPPTRAHPPPHHAHLPAITSPPPHEPSSAPPSTPSPHPPSGNQTENDSNPHSPASTISTGNGGVEGVEVIAISIAAVISVLSLLGLIIWCLRKKRRKVSGLGGYAMPSLLDSSPRSESPLTKAHSPISVNGSGCLQLAADTNGLGNSRSCFTYEELATATNKFAHANLLGEGGFGSVYKGNLSGGRKVAVKELKIGSSQGEREFKAEVDIISRIHHRHLVTLAGYGVSLSRRLLVYDYVPNGTLHYHLHGKNVPILDWARRFKIACGAARGLAYLHDGCQPRIIHRDIKSSNILLNENFEAQVSDFGLAKLAFDANTHVTTRVMGTFGYVAPEYASSGKLTEKSDVFSFGVVLLELITGRKPVDMSRPFGDENLVEWARPMLGHALNGEEFESLVDPRLEKNYVESEMFRMIKVAAACVRHSSTRRPRMGQVVRAFDMGGSLDLTNGMRVGESKAFNSAQQSAEINFFRMLAFGSQDYSTGFLVQGSNV